MSKVKIPRKLKKAARDMVVYYYPYRNNEVMDDYIRTGIFPTALSYTEYIDIKPKDGVRATKWRNKAKYAAIRERKAMIKATLKDCNRAFMYQLEQGLSSDPYIYIQKL